jgi:hypothetical protein
MKHPAHISFLTAVLAAGALFATGCDTTIGGGSAGPGPGGPAGNSGNSGTSGASGTNGTGGASGTNGTGGASGNGTGGGNPTPTGCQGSDVTTPKRLVRLLDRQLVNSYTSLFGSTAVQTIATGLVFDPLISRAFPPLNGEVSVDQTQFSTADRLAQGAMAFVRTNPTVVAPSCGAMPTDANCVQQALFAFAEKAWRKPLTDELRTEISGQFWTEMTAVSPAGAGATVAEALPYGVYGILMSPEFLYRTEFGTDPTAEGNLAAYELASQISYFVTNGPPDADLLAAAQSGGLNDQAQVRAQARRLMQTAEARLNLETAILGRFDIGKLRSAVITPNLVPWLTGGVTEGLLSSIFHEGELFVRNTLWAGPLNGLLTARRTWIRAEMAPIYGVAAPTQLDADMFGPVDLGPERAGLLTLSAFLTSRTRPEHGTSAVARGLAINDAIICRVNPPFPEVIDPMTGQTMPDPVVAAAIAMMATWPENERYQYRITTGACQGCHLGFDGFGMVLEGFDALGKTRTADLQGRVIDAAWTTAPLPDAVAYDTNGDGTPDPITATNPLEMADAVIGSGAFQRCFALNFIDFALSDVSQGGARYNGEDPTTGCATRGVMNAFATTDQSFESLIAEIAASNTLMKRARGM